MRVLAGRPNAIARVVVAGLAAASVAHAGSPPDPRRAAETRAYFAQVDREKSEQIYAESDFDAHQSARTMELDTAAEACGVVSGPGDFILIASRDGDGSESADFREDLSRLIRAKESLSFHAAKIRYTHAEVLTEIEEPANLISWSFYPPIMQKPTPENPTYRRHSANDSTYRDTFGVFTIKTDLWSQQRERREKALDHVDNRESFWKLTTCADFVNWAYDWYVTSGWNFVPALRHLVSLVYLPEGMRSPDDMAFSPYTRMECRVNDGRLVFPTRMLTSKLMARLKTDLGSRRPEIASHARAIRGRLEREGFIDINGDVRIERIDFAVRDQ